MGCKFFPPLSTVSAYIMMMMMMMVLVDDVQDYIQEPQRIELLVKAKTLSDCHHGIAKVKESASSSSSSYAVGDEEQEDSCGTDDDDDDDDDKATRVRQLCVEKTPVFLKERVRLGLPLPKMEELLSGGDDDDDEVGAGEKLVKATIEFVIDGGLAPEVFIDLLEYMNVSENWFECECE